MFTFKQWQDEYWDKLYQDWKDAGCNNSFELFCYRKWYKRVNNQLLYDNKPSILGLLIR